jgi:hypothetical protein
LAAHIGHWRNEFANAPARISYEKAKVIEREIEPLTAFQPVPAQPRPDPECLRRKPSQLLIKTGLLFP